MALLREPRIGRIGSIYGDGTAVHLVRLTDIPDLEQKWSFLLAYQQQGPPYTDTRQAGVGVLGTALTTFTVSITKPFPQFERKSVF